MSCWLLVYERPRHAVILRSRLSSEGMTALLFRDAPPPLFAVVHQRGHTIIGASWENEFFEAAKSYSAQLTDVLVSKFSVVHRQQDPILFG